MPDVPSLRLHDGRSIPQIGFGTFRVEPGETQQAVEEALAAGYRHIDGAAGYENEKEVGAAVAASGLKRSDVWLTSKLRNGDQHDPRRFLEKTLTELGTDHLDLYLIHWPHPTLGRYVQTWKDLIELQAEGLIRSIGVSNFLPHHLDDIVAETGVVPVVDQIELHPSLQQRDAQEAASSRGIAVEAWSPLGVGQDLTDPKVVEIAEAHDATPAQAVLAWHLASGTIVIPKSLNPQRMAENLGAAPIELSDDELQRIDSLEAGNRIGPHPDTLADSQYPR